jgi:RNA polymerase-binding transcription factor DksA
LTTNADEIGARLTAERERLRAQVRELRGHFDAIVEASRDTAADDEHDPDGATIGFERAQAAALLEAAEARLRAVDAALARVRAGDYGRCTRCGTPITPERLAALPAASTCVACAASR